MGIAEEEEGGRKDRREGRKWKMCLRMGMLDSSQKDIKATHVFVSSVELLLSEIEN